MNVHKNARMTVHGRLLLVARVRDHGWRVETAALAAGVSVRTAGRRDRVGGKRRELLLDIDSFATPVEKRPDGEAMPEVVYARPGVIAGAAQPAASM